MLTVSRRPALLLIFWLAGAALFGAAPATPAAEKTLVYALSGIPESLDSAKAATERSIRVTWLLCDALITISKDGRHIEPGLAESWTVSRDGLNVRMKLRAGVLFHDGSPLDANAVKTSFERQFDPGHPLYTPTPKNTKEKLLSELVDEVAVHDPLTMSFRLKYPGLHYFSQIDVVSATALARVGKDFGRKPVCSGPFKLATWTNEQLVLVANDRYWAGRPRIDRVVFRVVNEPKALVDELLAGRIDLTHDVRSPAFIERLRESPSVKLVPVPGLNVLYLGFYTERPPFDDRLVRRAAAQAINVPRMALFLGRGTAVPAKGPLSPAMKGYDSEVSQAPHDPAAAHEFLTRARWDPKRSLRLVHNSALAMDAETAGAIQADLRRVGVTVELVGKPSQGEVATAVRAREGDMFLNGWHLRAPYPERLLVPLFHSRSGGTTNLTRYTNPAVDKLLDDALRLPDGPELNRIYSRVQHLVVNDAPMVFLYHLTRIVVHSARLRGLEMTVGMDPHDRLVGVDLVE